MTAENQVTETNVADVSGPATAVLTSPRSIPSPRKPRPLPLFKVLLHNDDVNTFEHVILSILKLTPLNAEDAIEKTLEADRAGVALLLVTHKERAELYQDQFQSVQLTVTIEPDEA